MEANAIKKCNLLTLPILKALLGPFHLYKPPVHALAILPSGIQEEIRSTPHLAPIGVEVASSHEAGVS